MAEGTSEARGGRRRNGAVWAGFALGFLALGANAAFFVRMPGQRAVPWVSLALGAAALILLAVGLKRAFAEPQVYRGKALSVILAVIALLPTSGAILGFFHSRAVPASAGAPQVGQRAPEFALADTGGKTVSLAQLLGPAAGDAAPKAVLLVFYRGYW